MLAWRRTSSASRAVLQRLIALTDADRDIEMKGKIGMRRVTFDGRDLERNRGLPHEVSGERAPRHRHVYLAICNSLDQIGGRIFLVEVAEDAEADEIANDAAAGERMHGRRLSSCSPRMCTPIFSVRRRGSSKDVMCRWRSRREIKT